LHLGTVAHAACAASALGSRSLPRMTTGLLTNLVGLVTSGQGAAAVSGCEVRANSGTETVSGAWTGAPQS